VRESIASERHDDFGRDGDAGGLNRHEKDDGGISAGCDGGYE